MSRRLGKIEEARRKRITKLDEKAKKLSGADQDSDSDGGAGKSEELSKIEQKKQKNMEKMYKYQ